MRKQYHFRRVGADTHIWDVHKLVRLAAPLAPQPVLLANIAELDEDWWFKDAADLPTPRTIVDHIRLVQDADLTHPIILCSEGRLMDGMHRVTKALLGGHATISAVRLPVTPPPDFLNMPAQELPYGDEDI